MTAHREYGWGQRPTVIAGRGDDEAEEFAEELVAIRALGHRSELKVEEVPAPQRLAPQSLAISASVDVGGVEVASGRLVILHNPDGDPSWPGRYRLVGFARAELEADLAEDPMLGDVAWSWLTEALEDLSTEALGGTVTRTCGTGFGRLADDAVTGHVEIRASWSPEGRPQLADHVSAWLALLAVAAGLPPIGTAAQLSRNERSRD